MNDFTTLNPDPTQWSESQILDVLYLWTKSNNCVTKEFLRVCLENAKLFDRKQTDYGPRNISGFGTFGVIVRMNDKFERLKTLMSKKRRKPQNESVMDSLRDISNYANIAILLETNHWPD